MKISGTEMSSMTTGLKTLTNKLDDAKNGSDSAQEMFSKLGLSMEDLSSMSREDVFSAVITGFQGMEDSAERAALANDLFGKSGQELAPLFNTTAEETARLKDEVNNLGGVMTDEAVKASAAFQDQLTALQTSFSGISRNLIADFLPSLTQVMGGLTEIFSGNGESGIAMINEGINSIVEGVTEKLPQITETGMKILESLTSAIIENLPKVMSAGMQIISELARYIIDALPTILQTGIEIIVELAEGIAEALPDLLPAALDAVLEFCMGLLDNIDKLIDAAGKLIIGLAEGLIKALPKLIDKAPTIISKLVQALIKLVPEILKVAVELIAKLATGLISNVGKLLTAGTQLIADLFNTIFGAISNFGEIGSNIVEGIKNGISNAWGNMVSWFKGLFGDLTKIAKDILGIASPSKVFRKIGEYTVEGFDIGMQDFGVGAMQDVQNAMDEISGMSATVDAIGTSATGSMGASVPSRSADMGAIEELLSRYLPMLENGTNVNVSLQGDAQGLFRTVRKEVNQFTKSTGNSPFIAPA